MREERIGAELAFEFVESIHRLTSPDAVFFEFRRAASQFGYSTVVVGELPAVRGKFPAFFRSTWSPAFVEEYVGEGLIETDPSVEAGRERILPVRWSDLLDERRAKGGDLRHFDIIRAHGFPQGIAIPVHGPSGYRALVTVAGETKELPPRHRVALHLMGLYLHARMRELLAPELAALPDDEPRLSPGEIECIHWLIAGKTDWEIGEILGIAEATAHWRIERAKKKLGVKTRAQLTALAVHRGLIQL